jgi:glycosyltransferase involved in cell wall biosynthesis
MISVLILTRNEENNLPDCLRTVAWSDDIHVLDSLSSDRTVEIANSAGAHITQRPFDNWAAHQNWAMTHLPFRYPWVFYLDADERVTPDLAEEMQRTVASHPAFIAYRIHRRDFLGTQWLKHSQLSPYYIRLFRPEKMRYERLVNPRSVVDGPVGRLRGYLDHYPFSKGLEDWLARHDRYSTLEAEQSELNRDKARDLSLRSALFERDFHKRRYHQKELFYRMPGRPWIKFFYLYFLRRGFLDGGAGFTYARLQSRYESMIVRKTRELKRSNTAASLGKDA